MRNKSVKTTFTYESERFKVSSLRLQGDGGVNFD